MPRTNQKLNIRLNAVKFLVTQTQAKYRSIGKPKITKARTGRQCKAEI